MSLTLASIIDRFRSPVGQLLLAARDDSIDPGGLLAEDSLAPGRLQRGACAVVSCSLVETRA
jgi:hypothetical protein